MKMARIGIDFGYKYTGVALLDDNNKVLAARTIQHRTDISELLENRRMRRAARRRNTARRRRLRDFYALLSGMGLQPKNSRPGETMSNEDRMLPGNRLYALAHHRGWDYAEIRDQLVQKEDDKPPKPGVAVSLTDQMLIREFAAPAIFDDKVNKRKNQSKAEFDDQKAAAQEAIAERAAQLRQGKTPQELDDKYLRFAKLPNPFLGELYRLEKAIYDAKKEMEKEKTIEARRKELEEEIFGDVDTPGFQVQCDDIYELLGGRDDNKVNNEKVEEWIGGRADAVYGGHRPLKNKNIVIDRAMRYLGLKTNEELFEAGKVYRPHRNRHRSVMEGELDELLSAILGDDENDSREKFEAAFKKVIAKREWKEAAAAKEHCWTAWKESAAAAKQKATNNTAQRATKENRPVAAENIIAFWKHSAEKIITREYRQKRFSNRKVGKCPARLENGERCGKNLPTKAKAEIRALQFEIEARQMNVIDNGEKRNLTEPEISSLLGEMWFADEQRRGKKPSAGEITRTRKAINSLNTPPVKDDARGKKEILRDIAVGEQGGRAGFCICHLRRKLALLRDDNTQSEEWNSLHEERILELSDAPPSIRQKVQRVVSAVQKMLKDNGIDKITHIGLESARFDISKLAQEEGRKGKKWKPREYQTSRRPDDRQGLADAQGGLCLLCGETLGGDIHIDHFVPRARGGANVRLNMVAVHYYCNIDKGKSIFSVNKKAMNLLRKNDPDKAKKLDKILTDGKLPDDMTKAAQHTMFGAKVLRGALAEELKIPASAKDEKCVFHRPRAADVAFLRKRWFPFMDGQKRALREKKRNPFTLEFTAGKETKKPLPKFFPPDAELTLENGGWLQLKDGELIGNPTTADAGVRDFFVFAANSTDRQRLRVAAVPGDDDPIHQFHHILDAAVLAANVDWESILRLDKKMDAPAENAQQRQKHERAKQRREKAAKRAPDFSSWETLPTVEIDGVEEERAPAGDYVFEDKAKSDSVHLQKYNTEPYRRRDGKLSKRIPLPQIKRKDIDNILNADIRAAMTTAWKKIDNEKNEEQRKAWTTTAGNKTCISTRYFLDLPKDDSLHPLNTRAARCWIRAGTGPKSFDGLEDKTHPRTDKRENKTHYFERTENWAVAIVYQHGKKKTTVRQKARFYWRDKTAPESPTNHDAPIPPGAKIIARFSKSDKVTVADEKKPGIWEITKLGKSATLSPVCKEAKDALGGKETLAAAYTKLTKLRRKK